MFCTFTTAKAKAARDSGLVEMLLVHVGDYGGSAYHEFTPARAAKVRRIIRLLCLGLALSMLNMRIVGRLKLKGVLLDTEAMNIGILFRRRGKLVRTASEGWRWRAREAVRFVHQLVGKITGLELARGPVCRLRSCYWLQSARDAARAWNYRRFTVLGFHAAGEVKSSNRSTAQPKRVATRNSG